MISATILTKNSAETLAATLESLREFSEVLVFDTGSTDKTVELAKSYPNVRVVEEQFQGFGKTHNAASNLAKYEWIFSVDSDEVVSPKLSKEILSLSLDPETTYSVDRQNYFRGKYIYCWNPDRLIRLYHRGNTHFTDAEVHEQIIATKTIPLAGSLLHTPYQTIEHFLAKMQLYSTLFAEQNTGKRSSLGKAIGHGLAAFFKSYFLKRGFLSGKEGLIISLYNAHTAYYKYLKLAMKFNRQRG